MSDVIELKNVRSISTGQGIRIRCDIDWYAQPGDTVRWQSYEFVATYINYYVTRGGRDAYMDIGAAGG